MKLPVSYSLISCKYCRLKINKNKKFKYFCAASITAICIMSIPVTIGYIHVIFLFLLTCFLNWYIEILEHLQEYHCTPMEIKIQLYSRLVQNVSSFTRLFGTCLVIDMAHSVTRVVFSAYFVASFSNRLLANLRGISSDVVTVIGYFYLVFIICKMGSQIGRQSGEFVENCEDKSSQKADKFNENNHLLLSYANLKPIWIETDFFRVYLGLI